MARRNDMTKTESPDDIMELFVDTCSGLMIKYRHGGRRRVTGAEMDMLLKALRQYNTDKRVAS